MADWPLAFMVVGIFLSIALMGWAVAWSEAKQRGGRR